MVTLDARHSLEIAFGRQHWRQKVNAASLRCKADKTQRRDTENGSANKIPSIEKVRFQHFAAQLVPPDL